MTEFRYDFLSAIVYEIETEGKYAGRRTEVMGEAFGEWESKNNLVNSVLMGGKTFAGEYDTVVGEYVKYASFANPTYSLSKSMRDRLGDLEKCIGTVPPGYSFLTKQGFPLSSGFGAVAGAVTFGMLALVAQGTDPKISRRKFLALPFGLVGSTLAGAATGGATFDWLIGQDSQGMKLRAVDLDETVSKYSLLHQNLT